MRITTLLLLTFLTTPISLSATPKAPADQPDSATQVRPIPTQLVAGNQLFVDGNFLEAEKKISRSLKQLRDSEKDFAFELLGRISLELKQYQKAERFLLKSLSYRARNSDALSYLGIAQFQNGKSELAIRSLHEAIWFQRYHSFSAAETYHRLSLIHKELGQDEEALASLQNALKQGAPSEQSLVPLTDLLLQSGKREEALALFAKKKSTIDTAEPVVQIAYAKALLTNPDRKREKKTLSSVDELLEKLTAQSDLGTEEKQQVEVLSIRSRLANGKLKQAAAQLDTALSQRPSDAYLLRLKDQLDIERSSEEALEAQSLTDNTQRDNS